MSSQVRIFRVDAFTAVPCTGNPACVVLDAGALERAHPAIAHARTGRCRCGLRAAARCFRSRPAAAFLHSPYRDRRWWATQRSQSHAVLDALGHPLARRQKQRGGIIDIERLADPQGTLYAFSQPLPAVHGPLPSDRLTPILSALGVAAAELDPDCPPVVAGVGGNRALIALRSRRHPGTACARIYPDLRSSPPPAVRQDSLCTLWRPRSPIATRKRACFARPWASQKTR